MYDYYLSEQSQKIKRIVNPDDRLEYLNNEKDRFALNNRGSDEANSIVQWFDSQIDKTRFEIMKAITLQAAKLSQVDTNSNKRNKKTIPDENITLVEFFESVSKYKEVMEMLVDKNYCQANTYIWSDFNTSRTNRRTVISVIKYLQSQGYYKSNMRFTNEQIKGIAKNTFGVEASLSLIKQHKVNNVEVKFIPIASTLK